MKMNGMIIKCDNCNTKNCIPRNRINDGPVCGKCGSTLPNAPFYDKPVKISDKTFNNEVIDYPGPVLVDCCAPWCAPCRMMEPVFEQLASEYAGKLKITKLNVDENPITSSIYAIKSVPTMLLFNNGEKIDSLSGYSQNQK